MLVLLIIDCGIWLGMYLGITELTGEFNRYEWADLLLPLLISVFTLSLIGAYDPRPLPFILWLRLVVRSLPVARFSVFPFWDSRFSPFCRGGFCIPRRWDPGRVGGCS